MYTIQDLREGKVAVKNDGTLKELRKVLKQAFPGDDKYIHGDSSIYFKSDLFHKKWTCLEYLSSKPTQSVKDFLKEDEYPKVMWVSANKKAWEKRVVFMEKNNVYLAWVKAKNLSQSKYVNQVTVWKYAKDIEEIPEYTMEELTEKLGHEFKLKKQ